jgi:hypothetical protein
MAKSLHADEQALVESASEFIQNFIATRFSETLPPEWRVAMAEVCLEMFEAGAAWADATSGRDRQSIIRP